MVTSGAGNPGRLAVIPARGGSKRIPRKNIRMFRGVPLLERTIRRLLAAEVVDLVVVSTDDREIAEIAEASGATCPFVRGDQLADDHTPTKPVVRDAILRTEGAMERTFNEVCVVYPASVFLRSSDVHAGLHMLRESHFDHVFSSAALPAPIQRAWSVQSSGEAAMMWPENSDTRSQDLPEAVYDAGQFYWGSREFWVESDGYANSRVGAYRLPRWLVHDIDTEEDWILAEAMHEVLTSQSRLD